MLIVNHQYPNDFAAALQYAEEMQPHLPLRFLDEQASDTKDLLVQLRAARRSLRGESLLLSVSDFRKWMRDYKVLGCSMSIELADAEARACGAVAVAKLSRPGGIVWWRRRTIA
jgi:hypothetical protein